MALISVAAAVLCGLQAASNVLAKTSPQLSARISPYAAVAWQELAASNFWSLAIQAYGKGDEGPLKASVAYAETAVDRAPLSADAVAILGYSEADPTRQDRIFSAAAQLSKRGRLLQSILLFHYGKRQDLPRSLATLDRLFKVYPETKPAILPRLTAELVKDEALPVFVDLLEERPSWGNDFLSFAARDPRLAPNLARLRLALGANAGIPEDIDRAVLARLFAAGKETEAYAIYRMHRKPPPADSNVDWRTKFPPFDWLLTDRDGSYARINASGTEMELYWRRGKGGTVAERVLDKPPSKDALLIKHSVIPGKSKANVRLTASCLDGGRGTAEAMLGPSPMLWSLRDLGENCRRFRLVIAGQAWESNEAIEGNIQAFLWQSERPGQMTTLRSPAS